MYARKFILPRSFALNTRSNAFAHTPIRIRLHDYSRLLTRSFALSRTTLTRAQKT